MLLKNFQFWKEIVFIVFFSWISNVLHKIRVAMFEMLIPRMPIKQPIAYVTNDVKVGRLKITYKSYVLMKVWTFQVGMWRNSRNVTEATRQMTFSQTLTYRILPRNLTKPILRISIFRFSLWLNSSVTWDGLRWQKHCSTHLVTMTKIFKSITSSQETSR